MYLLNGFAPHAVMAVNVPGANNPIGEISTQSLTYTKEKGIYKSTDYPGPVLIAFRSVEDDTEVEASLAVTTQVLKIAKRVYDRTLNNPNVEQATDVILDDLRTQYSAEASNFAGGAIVSDGRYWMPSWISWSKNDLPGSVIKIWFADAAFRTQYPFFDITVVPPIDNLDDFFLPGAQVETLLKARTLPVTMEKAQEAANNQPYSVIRAETYDYHDPNSVTRIVPSNWAVLIYGEAGNNIDSVKDAIVDYILSNSTHPREDWIKILPDLFRRSEFILVPLWDQYAIPNRVNTAGIFSPVARLQRVTALLKTVIPGYTSAHIDSYACVTGHPYKSLAIGVVGGPENRDDHFLITDEFPDFIAVSSTSQDFQRMSEKTKGWAEMFAQMLLVADTATDGTTLPIGMTKLTRDGITYIVKSYENFQYLVATRQSIDV